MKKSKLLISLCIPSAFISLPLVATSCGNGNNPQPVVDDRIPIELLNIQDGSLSGLTCAWDDPRISDCTTLYIPKDVVEVSSRAFVNMPEKITTVEFQDSDADSDPFAYPLYIEEQAFRGALATKIILPSRLLYVGREAFKGCTNVDELNLSAWESEQTLVNNNPFIDEKIFEGWSEDAGTIVLPDGSTNSPELYYIFKGTSMPEEWLQDPGLDITTTADGRYQLGTKSGDNNVYLIGLAENAPAPENDTIEIPTQVTHIVPGAFAFKFMTSSLREQPKLTLKFTAGSLLKTIHAAAFYSCNNILAIDLSNCTVLSQIGPYAFSRCNIGYKQTYGWEDDQSKLKLPEGATLKTLGVGAFSYNENLKHLYLKKCQGIKEIYPLVCANNSWFSRITWPDERREDSPAYIYSGAFQNTLGNQYDDTTKNSYDIIEPYIKFVGYRAFYKSSATKIEIVKATKNEQIISEECFYQSTNVKDLIIPSSVTTVLDRAFAGLSSLKTIDFSDFETLPTNWASTSFAYSPNDVSVSYSNKISEDEIKSFFINCGVDDYVLSTWEFTPITLSNN